MSAADGPDLIAGRRILVTGANGGIGRALIAAFSRAGAGEIVAAVNRRHTPFDIPVRTVTLDISDAAASARLGTELADAVDILVNNAGVNSNTTLLDADPGIARREMEVNYFGTLELTRAFAPAMRRRRAGVIVNIMTLGSHVSFPHMGSYCASKAALHSLTQAARAELEPFGVRVVGVYPPAVDTAMSAHITAPKILPAQVAQEVMAGIQDGREDIFVGPADALYQRLRAEPKVVERMLAARLRPSR